MASLENINTAIAEVNLKTFIKNALSRKLFFLISLIGCLAVAFLYIKMATPIYQVSTSLIIDPSGNSRMLGDSKYVDGAVGLIGMEKNLFNEISIIKSYSLIKQTLEDLPFEVSYHSASWFKKKEHYGYFPVEVQVLDTSAQLFNAPFQIEILSDNKYRLSIKADDFLVSNPNTDTKHEVSKSFVYSEVHSLGQPVKHDYFHFIISKPRYNVVLQEFEGNDLLFKINDIESLTQSYLDNLQIDQVDIQASILNLGLKGPIVAKGKAFLEKLNFNYLNNKLLERNEIASSKETFIRDQLISISDSLNRAEGNLEAFQRSAGAVNLTATATNALLEVQKLQSEKAQLDLNVDYYSSMLQYLGDSTNSDKVMALSVVGVDDPLLNENLLELRRLYLKKTQPLVEANEGLPILNRQIQSVTTAVQENLKNLIQTSQSVGNSLNQRIYVQDRIIDQLPGEEKQLVGFQRKRVLYDNLFNYLNQELAKTAIARAEDIPDTKVLDEPRGIGGPVSPQKKIILAMAVIIGLIIPIGWIVFFDSFEGSIDSRNELEACSNIPIAASIAHYHSGLLLFKKDNADWRVEESFRDLSASLQFLIADKTKNIIGVTSTVPDEGKTFIATNLAIILAKTGKKVMVINADFRNPSMLKDVKSNETKDLSSFLMDRVESIAEITKEHKEINNLYFIPTILEEDNPPKILSSLKWESLLQELASSYDYVIVDSPALGLVSDYLLISKYVDVHLFVVRRNVTKPSFLKELAKLRKNGKLERIFLIFNDAGGKTFKYGYSDYQYGDPDKKHAGGA